MSDPVVRLNTALEGRYAIERELGEGGMATVYLANDLKHERKVALKVLKPELAAVVGATREFSERDPAVSANGQWLAYSSDETGQLDVFLRPFPNVDDAKIQVSTDGGVGPLWSHSGGELFYVSGDAMIEMEPELQVLDRDTLFTIPPEILVSSGTSFYDVALDDQRFLMGRMYQGGGGESGAAPRYILVQNFFEELKERVPN